MTAVTCTPSGSPSFDKCTAFLAGLDDENFAEWLDKLKAEKKEVVLVHAGTTCKAYEKAVTRGVLLPVDPEGKSKIALKALAKKKLLFVVPVSEIANTVLADNSWVPQETSVPDIDRFLEQRKIHLGRVDGRGDPISQDTANKVWADAGGCCMFKGCGLDLSNVPLYNKGKRIAYLAHIIASDPEGPRGTPNQSHILSNHPENIMLMCDAHHRLIDSFEPDSYKAPRLQEMRREHAAKIRMYRNAMQFPEAQAITLFADLGNVPTHFPDSDFIEALLAEGFSMNAEVKRHLTFEGRDDRTPPDFWGNYLREMELPIRTIVQALGKVPSSDVLAVFPLHHTPTLVLAGRIIGEARQVQVFQRSRVRKTWHWNSTSAVLPPGVFKVSGLTTNQADEVLLTVELTANIDSSSLPNTLAKAVEEGNMPWVRVTIDSPNGECIQRKEDLAQFVNVARTTINTIQDNIGARTVHLIAVCPVSAAFSLGQLMQPGHHAVFNLYDRPNGQYPFREAFSINGYSVVPPADSQHPPISIR
jgi:DNA-binding XRE family transcriptional regulator